MSLELNISNKDISVSTSPWINIIEDNFLPTDYFKILSEMPLDPITSKEVKVSHNYISNDLKTNLDNISQDLAVSIHLSCFSKLYDYLKLLAPKKIPLYDYSELHIVQTGSECTFPVHHDDREKLLSVVVYLSPEFSSGTYIYHSSSKSSLTYEVPWKQNRALIFARKEDKTWHSYSGSPSGTRRALVYNLMTKEPNKALLAEGIPIHRLIQKKINEKKDYLYKLFKKIRYFF